MPSIKLSSKQVFFLLAFLSFIFFFIHSLLAIARIYFQIPIANSAFAWTLDLSGDISIPTWYSSITLFFCTFLLLIIGKAKQKSKDKYSKQWLILSLIFMLLSIDEVAALHEKTTHFIDVPTLNGFLYYDWVVFGFIFVALVGLYYFKLLMSLPSSIKRLFFCSGLVFVGGALGLEIINSKIGFLVDSQTLLYSLVTGVEELFEMLGVAIFSYALLEYMTKFMNLQGVKIDFF